MFSEAIHSLADTCNQALLALGISQSVRNPDASRDPSTNVVLLEDAAAVLGVIMAAGCMGLTSLTAVSVAHRAIHDVKATDMGLSKVRFKAEVDFDGRVVTRSYLEKQDIDQILNDIQQVKTPEELENFMLKHGENIIDTLGAEVDRLEKELKVVEDEVVPSVVK
ncbi:hypothetical protein XENOCAPTIV_023933 [Xenoophorus captivus]|uniref:Zinc transporter 9 n=1 Tax=Xenoophorus captivus TaxID=1517983 RepID=A0ABV0QE86_9TELE